MGKGRAGRRKGRPRKTVRRYPNGSAHRSSTRQREEETRAVGYEARQRVFGMHPAQSRRQEATDAVGRLYLIGDISSTQLAAAREYALVVDRFEKAILARRPSSSGDLDRTRGYDGHDGSDPRYVAECEAAIKRRDEARRALLEADPFAWMAVTSWVLEDRPLYSLIGSLRVGLNALARVFKVEHWAPSGKTLDNTREIRTA